MKEEARKIEVQFNWLIQWMDGWNECMNGWAFFLPIKGTASDVVGIIAVTMFINTVRERRTVTSARGKSKQSTVRMCLKELFAILRGHDVDISFISQEPSPNLCPKLLRQQLSILLSDLPSSFGADLCQSQARPRVISPSLLDFWSIFIRQGKRGLGLGEWLSIPLRGALFPFQTLPRGQRLLARPWLFSLKKDEEK